MPKQQRSEATALVKLLFEHLNNKIMVFSQMKRPPRQSEKLNTQDLAVLDKTSLTSVVDFMRKFAEDASFTPPTREVAFDTDKFDISLDSDDLELDSNYSELEDFDDDVINSTRARKS